jgi:ribosome-associated protein
MGSKTPDNIDLLPSKSQRKRDARVYFELGRDLVAMSARQLASLPIEADLREAIDLARSIKSNVARKRQVQFIAKMMRHRDVQTIQEALLAEKLEARHLTVRHHRVEAWRDRLLSEGDEGLSALLMQRDSSEAQALRVLIRNARKEASLDKPPAAARKLFKLLREMDAESALPAIRGATSSSTA